MREANKITIELEYDEEAKLWSAVMPEQEYVSSCGKTPQDATKNIWEAYELYFEE